MLDFLTHKFSAAFSYLTGQKYLSEKNIAHTLQQIKDALLESDVPYHVVNTFLTEIENEVVGKEIIKSLNAQEQFAKIVYDKLTHFLGIEQSIGLSEKPISIMVMGLQGSGKTTTIAKLIHYFKQTNNHSFLVSSLDFYRPAAREQLDILTKKLSVNYLHSQKTSIIEAAHDFSNMMHQNYYDIALLDTAGRLHIDNLLIDELVQVAHIVKPTLKILVLDAMTGQESLAIAKAFDQHIGFDGVILTKMDSNTRSGAAFAFCYELKKPILFLGCGEKIEDLEHFKPDRLASRMIGMGDIQTFVEKAETKIKQDEAQSLERAFNSGKLTLEDFAYQLKFMNRIGSFSQLLRFMPGINAQQIKPENLELAEKQMKRSLAIINSMTPKERSNPKTLNQSRKQRIATGAGVAINDINSLLKQFEEIQQCAKLFKQMGPLQGLFK